VRRTPFGLHTPRSITLQALGNPRATSLTSANRPATCRRRTFRRFTYRGVDLEQLLDLGTEELIQLLPARARRRIGRGLKRKPLALIKKLREAKKNAAAGEWQGPASHGLAAVMQRSSACHTLCTH
jgi:hypothetical protein